MRSSPVPISVEAYFLLKIDTDCGFTDVLLLHEYHDFHFVFCMK